MAKLIVSKDCALCIENGAFDIQTRANILPVHELLNFVYDAIHGRATSIMFTDIPRQLIRLFVKDGAMQADVFQFTYDTDCAQKINTINFGALCKDSLRASLATLETALH